MSRFLRTKTTFAKIASDADELEEGFRVTRRMIFWSDARTSWKFLRLTQRGKCSGLSIDRFLRELFEMEYKEANVFRERNVFGRRCFGSKRLRAKMFSRQTSSGEDVFFLSSFIKKVLETRTPRSRARVRLSWHAQTNDKRC
jgi:hypothetical protein